MTHQHQIAQSPHPDRESRRAEPGAQTKTNSRSLHANHSNLRSWHFCHSGGPLLWEGATGIDTHLYVCHFMHFEIQFRRNLQSGISSFFLGICTIPSSTTSPSYSFSIPNQLSSPRLFHSLSVVNSLATLQEIKLEFLSCLRPQSPSISHFILSSNTNVY